MVLLAQLQYFPSAASTLSSKSAISCEKSSSFNSIVGIKASIHAFPIPLKELKICICCIVYQFCVTATSSQAFKFAFRHRAYILTFPNTPISLRYTLLGMCQTLPPSVCANFKSSALLCFSNNKAFVSTCNSLKHRFFHYKVSSSSSLS
jgi:hypothetical protein